MSYLEKEIKILQKLKAQDYAAFSGNKDRALNFVSQKLQSFPDYMDIVIRQQTMIPIWKARYDGPEFRERCQDIDRSRRLTHDNAISSINGLNRLCKKLELEPFSTVDTTDRYAVADMIQDYTNEIYNAGQNKSTQPEHRKSYDFQSHLAMLKERTEDYGPEPA